MKKWFCSALQVEVQEEIVWEINGLQTLIKIKAAYFCAVKINNKCLWKLLLECAQKNNTKQVRKG